MANDERERHEHFEHWAETYDQSRYQRFIFQRVHDGVLKLLAENRWPAGVVLDVGCGTGQLLEKVARANPQATLIGVDPVEQMIETARSHRQPADRFRFEIGSAEHIPVPDAGVDLVLSTISAHHWPDLPAAAREIERVLRPGGHLLLADFAPAGLIGRLAFHFSGDRMYNSDERQLAFEQSGLTVLFQRPLPGRLIRVLVTAAEHPA